MTVGEMPGASPDDAILYTDPERNEVNMIFTFEHMDLDSAPGGKWNLKPLHLVDLKENLANGKQRYITKVGTVCIGIIMTSHVLFLGLVMIRTYRVESAKMLATCLHFMQGTPYIYQGEEIGMTNVKFDSLDDYRDIETLNMYNERKSLGYSHEEIMDFDLRKRQGQCTNTYAVG